MPASINSYLSSLASAYYISHASPENDQILTSVGNIKTKLLNTFGSKLLSVTTFGSYERDTILPRKYDRKTDVDILVKFNHAALDKSVSTYREWLLDFANVNYARSSTYKNFPTIVVELAHIAFDLVPAKEEGYNNQLSIPHAVYGWQPTNPTEFNQLVSSANGRYTYIVKPIIRLLKAWNALADYPFTTYDLERQIATMSFQGDDIQNGFFYAIDRLNDNELTLASKSKLSTLRNNKYWVVQYLNRDDMPKAKESLHRILPFA